MQFQSKKFKLVLYYRNRKTIYRKLEGVLNMILEQNSMHLLLLSFTTIHLNRASRRKTKMKGNTQTTKDQRKHKVQFPRGAQLILIFNKKKNVILTTELNRILMRFLPIGPMSHIVLIRVKNIQGGKTTWIYLLKTKRTKQWKQILYGWKISIVMLLTLCCVQMGIRQFYIDKIR